MLKLSKILRQTGVALTLAAASLATFAAPLTTQLGFLIDASGSIGSGNFTTMKNGYASATWPAPWAKATWTAAPVWAFPWLPSSTPTKCWPNWPKPQKNKRKPLNFKQICHLTLTQ